MGANEACWSTDWRPLSIVASGANTHDVKLLEATLDQLVMEMPGRAGQYNLCADAGYKARRHRTQLWNGTIGRISSNGAKRPMKAHNTWIQGPSLGRGEDAFMDQPVPQIADQLRKDRGKLRCTSLTRLRFDLVEADCCYLRISSKLPALFSKAVAIILRSTLAMRLYWVRSCEDRVPALSLLQFCAHPFYFLVNFLVVERPKNVSSVSAS